ncbi:helix-turn-helix domain-containing protein [Halalkalicoccus subterraneus]|uniref:transcriptional regulator n=1 Tax=Halalkalicoccus subterraneus TaxID=2675002 RepID=UPI000EFB0E29|nr:transcriptional regulator [Halalkalicoccus subterraneus]
MRNDKRDEETGRFGEKFTDEEFINAVESGDLPTTSDVATAVDCNYRTAYGRLGDLEDAGVITSRKVGNSLVWTKEN